MVGFYKHDIPAWMNGTEALSDGAYRAYHVVVQLIMLNEGPIALNERGLAGRCNCTVKALVRALDELVAAGKLVVEGGQIHNRRAGQELESVMKNRENAGKGGKTRAIRAETQKNEGNEASKSLKSNDAPQAPLENVSSLKEKRREDTPIVPKGTDAGFEKFRAAYPERNVRFPTTQARKRYAEAIKRGATPDEIEAGAKAYAAEQARIGKVGTGFVKTADVWLNQNRWRDFATPAADDLLAAAVEPPPVADDAWRDRVRLWKARGGYWPWQQRSAPPDDPKTKVPAHILDEFGIRLSPADEAGRQAA